MNQVVYHNNNKQLNYTHQTYIDIKTTKDQWSWSDGAFHHYFKDLINHHILWYQLILLDLKTS